MADVTGGTAPTNASTFDVAGDISDVYDHFGDQSMFSVATASSLPASNNWVGRTLLAEDTQLFYVCTATPGTWKVLAGVDTGWTTIATFGSGWAATAGHAPRVRRVGNRVDLAGAVTRSTGSYADILTIPVGFRLGGTYTNWFVGAVTTSTGTSVSYNLTTLNKLEIPTGYHSAAAANPQVHPLIGTWYVD